MPVVPGPARSGLWLVRYEHQDVTVAGRVCVRVAAFDPDAVEPRLLEHHEQFVAEVEGFLEGVALVGFQVPVTPPLGTHLAGDDLGERVKVEDAGGEVKLAAVSRGAG